MRESAPDVENGIVVGQPERQSGTLRTAQPGVWLRELLDLGELLQVDEL